mgnify:CR=1 FL=1
MHIENGVVYLEIIIIPDGNIFFDWLNHSMKGEQLPEPDYYPIEKKWVHSTQQSTIPNINLYEIVEKCLNFK